MSTLDLKVRRDIGRQRWQFVAVLVAVVLGVGLFAASFNAYLNLGTSLDGSYERLRAANMTVIGVDPAFAEDVRTIEGVEEAVARREADVPFVIEGDTLLGRVSGMPPGAQPPVNQLDIEDGTYLDPSVPNGIVLESHAAGDFDLAVGDTFTVAGGEVEVVGIGVSTEYLWPARDSQNVFSPPRSFAVAFVNEGVLDAVDGAAVTQQVLVRYEDGVDVDELDRAVGAAAESAGAGQLQPLAEQPSDVVIRTEIEGLQTMAIALPLLFLAAAGMAIWVVVTRLVFAQRGIIGTLRANGFSRRAMSRHYLMYGLGSGVVGAAIGIVLGSLGARVMTALYTRVFGIPDLVAEFHLPTVVVALAFGAGAGTIAGIAPARTVARMAPAEAMRGEVPREGGRESFVERLVPPLRRAPVRWRMTLRGIGRNKKRSTSMVLGVVLGMTLVLASWGMLDTMLLAIDRQFEEVALEDATVVMNVPVDDDEVAVVAAVDGVAIAEPVIALQASVGHGSEAFGTSLEGYVADTEVHGFDPPLTTDGALLGQAMRDELGVAVGDEVTIDLPELGVRIATTVEGFVDEPLGTVAYLESDTLAASVAEADPTITDETLREPSITSVKAVFDAGSDRDAVLERLAELDTTAVVIDGREVRDLIQDFQAFFYLFVGLMVVFGGAMAFALVFNIISVNVAERAGEYASMRANGLTHRRVARMIVGETGILTAIGILPGCVVGYLAAVAFMNSFSSPEFPISAELRPLSYVATAIVMFIVAGLSLLPAVRAVKRIDIGRIVRERAA